MTDLRIVQSLEAHYHLRYNWDYLVTSKWCSLSYMFCDFLGQITAICIFHDEAESLGRLIYEGFFVLNNIWVLNTGKETNFVESVLLLFLAKWKHFYLQKIRITLESNYDVQMFFLLWSEPTKTYLFQSIKFTVWEPLDKVDCSEWSFA